MVASAAQTAPTLWSPTSINHSAAFNPQAKREPCLRALIEANANLEAADDDGTTALIWAARKSSEPCLRALIEAHANLEATEKDGSTALMIAARDARRRSKGPSTPCMCCLCLRGPRTWRLKPLLRTQERRPSSSQAPLVA